MVDKGFKKRSLENASDLMQEETPNSPGSSSSNAVNNPDAEMDVGVGKKKVAAKDVVAAGNDTSDSEPEPAAAATDAASGRRCPRRQWRRQRQLFQLRRRARLRAVATAAAAIPAA